MPGCMAYLKDSGLSPVVSEIARNKPLLGICIGEQMLFDWSAEGDTPGLGLLPGRVHCFNLKHLRHPDGAVIKVPHMGWSRVRQTQNHFLWKNIPDYTYFYFVHSYYAQAAISADIAGETNYGLAFTSAVARDNIFAAQFHPEKSATMGILMLQNFLKWRP